MMYNLSRLIKWGLYTMYIILWIGVFAAAFVIGLLGFCQIIGTINYPERFSTFSAVLILFTWIIILAACAFAALYWLQNYCKVAFFIGYGISLILSFKVRPDSEEPQTDMTNAGNVDMPESEELKYLDITIDKLESLYNNAVRDLGDNTEEDVEELYMRGMVTAKGKDEMIDSIRSLKAIIDITPSHIEYYRKKRDELSKK